MIELIEVGNESCFKENMQLSELSKINYIFGPNGSGKTTISELLATNDTENRSSIHWLHNETKTIKVYNYHSARTTFTKTDGEEPGVFLLGDDSKEKRDKIEAYSAAGKTWFGWWLVEHYFSYHVNCPDGCGLGEPTRGR